MAIYAIVENGSVTNIVEWDGSPLTTLEDGTVTGWQSPEGSTAIEVPDGTVVSIGWAYDGSHFAAPPVSPPSASDILSANTAMRDALLAQAAISIAPLQDAVDLDEATDAETASLKAWKQYRIALNRVDLTQASPTWPSAPNS